MTCLVWGITLRGSFMDDRGCWVKKVHGVGRLALKEDRADQDHGWQKGTGNAWITG